MTAYLCTLNHFKETTDPDTRLKGQPHHFSNRKGTI